MNNSPRMLILFTFITALVVGGIAVLATDKWYAIIPPLLLHGIGSVIVLAGVSKRLAQGDKPDPVTEARLDEQGAGPDPG